MTDAAALAPDDLDWGGCWKANIAFLNAQAAGAVPADCVKAAIVAYLQEVGHPTSIDLGLDDGGPWHVEDSVTGARASKDFDNYEPTAGTETEHEAEENQGQRGSTR